MNPRLIIAGGGLAGCLAALALARRRPDMPFLLLEEGQAFGGNHIWSFFDSDVDEKNRWLVEPFIGRHWPDHEVRFPKRSRRIEIGYNSIRSADLDHHVRQHLQPDRYRLGTAVSEIGPSHVRLACGERLEADGVIDARGPEAAPGLDLAWQKFVGRIYRCHEPHGCVRPIIMDATVAQDDGYRFVYTLPFSDTELMVEDTYYSASAELHPPQLRSRIEQYLDAQGLSGAELVSEETGVLPILLAGSVDALWRSGDSNVAKLGLRGGFFHPTTGYSLPDAVRNAVLLAELGDHSSLALWRLFRGRAGHLWQERRYFQFLNRMLFRAAAPSERYRVLEHFYRLPEAVVGRFYAARLTALDKLRIVSGRPPVSLGRAVHALRRAH